MKRKSIILLSSILAGSLLVGGAFAAYAVTDNADPFGINVTPGNVDDDKTTYVTLEWGGSTSLGGVGMLKIGENRKVGVVSLVSSKNYTGTFQVTISDQTDDRTAGEYLFNYLSVAVYQGNVDLVPETGALPEGSHAADITKGAVSSGDREKEAHFNAPGTPAGTEYSIFVTLDSAVSPTLFEGMANDKVRLEVDWSKKDSDIVASTKPVFYDNTSTNWSKVYAFAWTGSTVNAEWPGVEMTLYKGKVFNGLVSVGMENIIFNNGGKGEGNQTADISMLSTAEYASKYDPSERTLWDGAKWINYNESKEEVVVTATLTRATVTTPIELVKEPDPGDNQAVYKIADLQVGDKITFNYGLETIHFYHWDATQAKVVDDGTTYTVATEGLHTFYYNANGEMFVGAPAAAVTYYLVGTHNNWTMNPASAMNKMSDIHYQSGVVELAAGTKLKVSDGTNWFNNASTYDDCGYTISPDEDRNVVVSTTGNYKVNLYLDSTNGNYITLVSQA